MLRCFNDGVKKAKPTGFVISDRMWQTGRTTLEAGDGEGFYIHLLQDRPLRK
jgi:hypothetical protein